MYTRRLSQVLSGRNLDDVRKITFSSLRETPSAVEEEAEGALDFGAACVCSRSNCAWSRSWYFKSTKLGLTSVSALKRLLSLLLNNPASATIQGQSLLHSMLSNSSLAALVTGDDHRHVFFQDVAGNIREAVYPSSGGQWQAGIDKVVATDARNHTPISVFQVTGKAPYPVSRHPPLADVIGSMKTDTCKICLFYIAANDSLAVQTFQAGSWSNSASGSPASAFASVGSDTGLQKFTAASGSRTLSATYVPGNDTGSAYFIYQIPDGNITALLASPHPSEDGYTWQDIDFKSADDRYGYPALDGSVVSSTISKTGNGVDFYTFGLGKYANASDSRIYTLQHGNGTWTGSVLMHNQ